MYLIVHFINQLLYIYIWLGHKPLIMTIQYREITYVHQFVRAMPIDGRGHRLPVCTLREETNTLLMAMVLHILNSK